MLSIKLKNTVATEKFGKQLSTTLSSPCLVLLKGELGAGKTTLVRGFLRGLGVVESIKSPTFTLVESYPVTQGTVYHFDLYRIVDPKELEVIGFREYFDQKSLVFIEWPEQGAEYIPAPDLEIALKVIPEGREMLLTSFTEKGHGVIKGLQSYE